jgi:hypothetical protein
MVRTSTAEDNNYICPACGDRLKRDLSEAGWVAHVSNPRCDFERGEKDMPETIAAPQSPVHMALAHTPSGGVRVVGYSERGIFNSLLYEIGLSPNAIELLGELLGLIHFPVGKPNFTGLCGAEVLVEQSLSDFGDADLILLLHGEGWRRVVFVEGKVKPAQLGAWTIDAAWRQFLARKNGKLDSSNLFTQLYHKIRFIRALQTDGIDGIVKGVPFPECSTKQLRKLGANPVVQKAAVMIGAYAEEAFFVTLVPDSRKNLEDFFDSDLRRGPDTDVTDWSTEGWGYLNWELIEEFCEEHELDSTLRVFEFNRGQLY